MKPILCFEQDCLHIDDSGATLTEAYCREQFAYWFDEGQTEDEVAFILEYEDDFLIVFQALNCEGESWKLMQSK